MTFLLRPATAEDHAAIQQLIAVSARGLSAHDYTVKQIESALRGTYGLDSQLIKDGTYFVVELDRKIVGCGGWSRRHTAFGGDQFGARNDALLDPAFDAAKIRAFFVHPDVARQGIAKLILQRCEHDAMANDFRRFELIATLPGLRFYATQGYTAGLPIQHLLEDGLTIDFVPMRKSF